MVPQQKHTPVTTDWQSQALSTTTCHPAVTSAMAFARDHEELQSPIASTFNIARRATGAGSLTVRLPGQSYTSDC